MGSWNSIPIANWCWKYKRNENDWNSEFLLDKFLGDYPELKEFFEFKANVWENISPWGFYESEE